MKLEARISAIIADETLKAYTYSYLSSISCAISFLLFPFGSVTPKFVSHSSIASSWSSVMSVI